MKWQSKVRCAPLVILAMALSACGGSSGGGSSGGSNNGGGSGGGGGMMPETQMDPPNTTQDTAIGRVFTNSAADLTLYIFENDINDADGDGAGDSDCNAGCTDAWPPLLAAAASVASGDFTIITRDDGTSLQWAFKGLPLYLFTGDAAAGDINGEGVNDIWYVARPDPWTTADVNDTASGTIFVGLGSVTGLDGAGGQGTMRVDREGLSLYTFENDRNDTDGDGAGDSDCNGGCAEAWPPLYADAGAVATGWFSIIDRDDMTQQWAYKGLPLYFYVADMAAGDTDGEGLGSIWYVARPNPIMVSSSSIGSLFTAATSIVDVDGTGAQAATRAARTGFSLYVFDNDANDTDGDGAGDSDCNGMCAVNWPPVYADAAATATGNFSIITRDDASLQWAFKGEPLYFFIGDAAAGDTTGDQVGTVWHVARQAPVQLFNDGALGDIFAARGNISDVDGSGNEAGTQSDRTGFTLYTFGNDTAGVSNCNGGCAVAWPPLYADMNDTAEGDFSIITRDDGSLQWAFQGEALYFYSGDAAAGDTNGVGIPSWFAVNP